MAATNLLFPKPATPGANPPDNATRRDAKRNPANSEEGRNKNANIESNKKVKVVETRGANKKEMGMFYLRNAEAQITDIFPEPTYEELEQALTDWMNPENADSDVASEEVNEAPFPSPTATNKPAATKVDDVSSAFNDLFN
jgi:hypothetical protein